MDYLTSWDGRKCALGDEVFELTKDPLCPSRRYLKGTRVRMIAGVDGRLDDPGYHPSKDYVTVCRIEATTAEFRGVKRSTLRPVV